ncbi:hypothetical protein Hanom_Chr08g00726911 [Helianthus anomalus]
MLTQPTHELAEMTPFTICVWRPNPFPTPLNHSARDRGMSSHCSVFTSCNIKQVGVDFF